MFVVDGKGGHQRLIPVSGRFFTSVVSYLDIERPADAGGVCGPRREPCAGCGHSRPVNIRDREGRPRCAQCPPGDGRDPVKTVVDIVAGIDPTLSAQAVTASVTASAPQTG
jgi:hypothetical protein